MSGVPDPTEVFDRAVDEGERRFDQSLLELVSTSFIAGFTIVFGIVRAFLLALGPFDHVVVTALYALFGVDIGIGVLAATLGVVTAGNPVGGLGLVTLSHHPGDRGNESGG